MGGSISDELDSNPDSDDHHLLLNNGSSSIHYGSHRWAMENRLCESRVKISRNLFDFRQKLLLLAKSTTSLSSTASSSVKANANQAASALNPSDPNYFGSPYRDGFCHALFLSLPFLSPSMGQHLSLHLTRENFYEVYRACQKNASQKREEN